MPDLTREEVEAIKVQCDTWTQITRLCDSWLNLEQRVREVELEKETRDLMIQRIKEATT